jgi:transcriptional regulator with XRE-family HTH domain
VELAERVGVTQRLVSDYERGRLRLNADIVVRFANALEISTDELLQPKESRSPLRRKPSLRVQRRVERIQELPPRRQYFVLKALDALLSSSAK